MKRKALVLPLMTLAVLLVAVSSSWADISSAAVLYLRIAPGARAAAMGEAYVAISDDATATHWNPAGLGTYPLADSWRESRIPAELRPIRSVAAVKSKGGSDYLAYEVWAVTARGLARYDNTRWHFGEVFPARSSQTVSQIAASYLNETDEDRIAALTRRVAIANNKGSLEELQQLRDTIMAQVPEDYSLRPELKTDFDSLTILYDDCRVDWDFLYEARKQMIEGMDDGKLSERELDRIAVAIGHASRRFIPEEITIPYEVAFSGDPVAIVSSGKLLTIGTTDGVVTYNGKKFQTATSEDGLPSNMVTCLSFDGRSVWVGTDSGVVRMAGAQVEIPRGSEDLPKLPVQAIGAMSSTDVWAVVGNDLYHYNGINWTNSMEYQVALEDTPETIAEKFALYGTAVERDVYIQKLREVAAQPETMEAKNQAPADTSMPEMTEAESADAEVTDAEAADTAMVADTVMAESDAVVDTAGSVEMAGDEPAVEVTPVPVNLGELLEPGRTISVPYVAGLKGKVNSVLVEANGRVWIGTEFGVLLFTGERWLYPGWQERTVEEGETLADILAMKRLGPNETEADYEEALRTVNDLDGDIVAGQTIKIYSKPLAAETRTVARRGDVLYAATDRGLLEFDGVAWRRADVGGLGAAYAVDAEVIDDELWLASDEKLVTKANGRKELTVMHVKWLPDLADDLYYEFLSYVFSKEGWGTFGLSVTYISYGTFNRTGEGGEDLGTFDSFDFAVSGSYGSRLSRKLAWGVTAKFLYSKLADQGAGKEQGSGNSIGFAVDFGLMYEWSSKMNLGLAITNLGPDMSYIDAAQSDPLPRNLAFGFAYKLLQSDYYHLLITAEANKLLVGVDDGFSTELEEIIYNAGAEFQYADLIAFRGGYIYDQEGNVKTLTLGAGLAYKFFRFDFSYIPKNTSSALANTLRISLSIMP